MPKSIFVEPAKVLAKSSIQQPDIPVNVYEKSIEELDWVGNFRFHFGEDSILSFEQLHLATEILEDLRHFYPDGTTSTARLLVSNQYNDLAAVTLRGLTGASRTEIVDSIEELGQ